MSGGFFEFTTLSVLPRAPTLATALGPARSASPSSTTRRSRASRPACRICIWPCDVACAGPRVGLGDRLGPGLVALQGRPPAGHGHGGCRRHVLHVGVLGDGVAAQPEPSRDFRLRGSRRRPGDDALTAAPGPVGGGSRVQTAQFLTAALPKRRWPFKATS